MKRIAASCSILTPRLGQQWRRVGWFGLAVAVVAAGICDIASEAPLCAGPSLACAVPLLVWIAGRLPAGRTAAANDNHPMPSVAWPRPRLRTVASGEQEFSGAGA